MPSEYTTVFLFTDASRPFFGLNLLAMGCGMLVFVLSLRAFVRSRRTQEPIEKAVIVGIPWGVGLALMELGTLGSYTARYLPYADTYRHHTYTVTDGTVHVLFQQPHGGHAPGDQIRVHGQTFDIDHFRDGPGYTQTIAYGGVLTEGAVVRIYHTDGVILRIDRQTPEHAYRQAIQAVCRHNEHHGRAIGSFSVRHSAANMPMQRDLLNLGNFGRYMAFQRPRASAPPSAGG